MQRAASAAPMDSEKEAASCRVEINDAQCADALSRSSELARHSTGSAAREMIAAKTTD
jgi:hypothetical protein